MSDSVINLLALAGDPGGAEAIAPVLVELSKGARYRVIVCSYRQATSVFSKHQLHSTELPESFSISDFSNLLAQEDICIVLSATSVNGVDLEKRLLRAASTANIPSMAVIDFWSNYTPRFLDEHGVLCLPTSIAVPNDRTKREMVEEGFPEDQIVVTGQPAFDRLAQISSQQVAATREIVREKIGVSTDERLVVFVSQPLTELYGSEAECLRKLGYTERSVLTALKESLGILRKQSLAIKLIVQSHPREPLDKWGSDCDGINTLTNPLDRPTLDLCMAADVVMGMTSVVLYECGVLGIGVISVDLATSNQAFCDCKQILIIKSLVPCDIANAVISQFSVSTPRRIELELAVNSIVRQVDMATLPGLGIH